MASFKKFPAPLSILMIIILAAAMTTWLLPAGKYDTLSYKEGNTFILTSPGKTIDLPFAQRTLDSLHILIQLKKFESGDIRKPVSVPGTYRKLPRNWQGLVSILEAPVQGFYDTSDIILFILVIGGFINIFNQSGAIEKGIVYLSYKTKGRESWLIIILTFLFVLAGSSYGMAEESLAFYPVLVPVFLAAGYDLIVPVAVIFMGTQIGTLSSVSNPFATIIASNAAGVNWVNGMFERIVMLLVSSAVTIFYIARYAEKVKKDPTTSLVYKIDGILPIPLAAGREYTPADKPDRRTILILLLFAWTFLIMVVGVIFLNWWLLVMSAIFFSSSLLLSFLIKMKEKVFIEKFIKGAEGLLSVTFIIALARGITIILNNGLISDSILFYSAEWVSKMPPALFIAILFVLFMTFTLFISSSSGMAVLTMPIMGSLAVIIGIPGREIVNAYLYGMGVMGLITPSGLILPALAMVNVSFKAWLKFVFPLMIILAVICTVFLVAGFFKK